MHETGTGREISRFSIEGKMTAATSGELRGAILLLVDCFDEIEIDLSQVSEIDVAGLLLLADAHLAAAERNKKLRFTGYSEPVREILSASPKALPTS